MRRVLLDTCAWIWLLSDRGRLSAAAAEAIERARGKGEAHLSVISCWEVGKLVEKGKLRLSIPVREWIRRATSLEGLRLHPLTPDLCADATALPGGLDGDPADRISVATARMLGVAVVTADRRIIAYPHVPTVW